MKNSVDPDQLASEKPADLDLHCFPTEYISMLSMLRVKMRSAPYMEILII